ncbi:hypothetical protein [Deinococcus roseus]|uniref:Uncharacterized protein n=1 Tax=Deinococcus roseus TaxID=392414 RepID=A0ABQ2DKE2_9DEIO|nr:hypothetical protein [Deinococcus roseus]GGJ60172.1 hypothetical protein GCM10008938_52860 [Deinococcus roseus]
MQSWKALEASVPFDELPELYKTFLRWRGLDPEGMNLRRAQQRVYGELNQMVQERKATREGEDYLLQVTLPFVQP